MWWLAPEGMGWPREAVREVLEGLVGRGLLLAWGETAGIRVYGLNPARAQEMRQFLLELQRES